jgi:hypothetical protein
MHVFQALAEPGQAIKRPEFGGFSQRSLFIQSF